MAISTHELLLLIKANASGASPVLKQVVADINGVDVKAQALATTTNRLALAQVQAAEAANKLQRAEQLLESTTDPARRAELANAIAKTRVEMDNANAKATKYAGDLNNLERESKEAAQAQDNLGNEVKQAAAEMKASSSQVSGAVGKLNDLLGGVGMGFSMAGIAAGMMAVGSASVDLARKFEQTKMAFTQMLGSAKAADEFLAKLRDFAAATPFEFSELTDAARRLMAFGFTAEEVIPMLRDIGDAVAAMGGSAAMVDRVTLALGQMSAKGKVSAGEMLQLTEAGIPGWEYLAQAIGKSKAEVMKLSEQGLLPAEQAIQAILAGMRADFGGMMAAQAQTAEGKISNMNDALEQLGTAAGTIALPPVKMLAETMTTAANAATMLVEWGGKVDAMLREHGDTVAKTANNYDEYSAEILRAQVAAQRINQTQADSYSIIARLGQQYGKLSLAQLQTALSSGEITAAEYEALKAYQSNKIAIDEKMKALGLMTEAEFDAAKAAQELAEYTAEQAEGFKLLAEAYAGAGKSASDFEMTEAQVIAAMDNLRLAMAGALDNEMRDFEEKQTSLKEKMAEYQQTIDDLSGKSYLTSAQKEELDAAKAGLADLKTEYANEAAAHEERTKRILFDITAQKLAQNSLKDAHSEYTAEEAKLLDELATRWNLTGVITGTAVRGMDTVLGEAVASGNWDGIGNRLNGIYQQVMGYTVPANEAMRDAFIKTGGAMGDAAIKAGDLKSWFDQMQDKKITFTTVYQTVGSPPQGNSGGDYGGSSNNSGGSDGIHLAYGGDFVVPPGYPSDSFGPMWAQSGERVIVQTPQQQRQSAQQQQRGSGGDTIIVNNPAAAAIIMQQRRMARVKRASAVMGG